MPPTKKILSLALAGALLFAACGDDDDDDVAADDSGITVEGDVGEDPIITIPEDFEVPTELVVEDLVEGDGEEVAAGANVSVFYEGALVDGTVFDGNFGDAQPLPFPLDQVITGWTEGIPGMRVGGRRLLVIPPDLAYGASGSGPIGPNETLVFVVDVVGAA